MIPKIAHFIWIGSPVPDWAQLNIESFRKHNPDFEIILHRFFPDDTPKWYYNLACDQDQFCQKVDLLRIAVLEKPGGIYFDIDFEFLAAIPDELLEGTGWAAKDGKGAINNAVIGVEAGSLQILRMIQRIHEMRHDAMIDRTSFGPSLLSRNNFGLKIFDRSYFYKGYEGKVARHSWGVAGSSHRKLNREYENVLKEIGPDGRFYQTHDLELADYIRNSHHCQVICM